MVRFKSRQCSDPAGHMSLETQLKSELKRELTGSTEM